MAFKRSKSKELLAYLVDRNGATCTNGEMLAVLWEDKPDTASLHSHLRNLIFDLSHTLEDAGVTGLLIRGRSTLRLTPARWIVIITISCGAAARPPIPIAASI